MRRAGYNSRRESTRTADVILLVGLGSQQDANTLDKGTETPFSQATPANNGVTTRNQKDIKTSKTMTTTDIQR